MNAKNPIDRNAKETSGGPDATAAPLHDRADHGRHLGAFGYLRPAVL